MSINEACSLMSMLKAVAYDGMPWHYVSKFSSPEGTDSMVA